MITKITKKLSSFVLCTALIVAMAFTTAGCNGKSDDAASKDAAKTESSAQENDSTQTDAPASGEDSQQTDADVPDETSAQDDVKTAGEGSTKFLFTVTDPDGNETAFEVHTDKETVGEALSDAGLIEGEEGQYGLYVTSVNGITADYDSDGLYWAFYINGEYAKQGVDSVTITEGDTYSFKAEKA